MNNKRDVIIENYQNPFNKGKAYNEFYETVNSNNESCIDDINLHVLFEKDIIKDITFDGEACAISTSSTSIMIKNLIGKTKSEALDYIINFESMVNGEKFDENILKDGVVYDDISKQKARKTCALLPYIGIKKLLK